MDALVDAKTGKFFPGVVSQLDNYLKLHADNNVIVMSVLKDKLLSIPKRFNPIQVPYKLRGSGEDLLDHISKKTGIKKTEMVVLGCKQHDMFTAAHTSSILLTANYAIKNNPSDRIFTKNYGIPLTNVASLGFFFESFYGIDNPWYFKVQVNEKTSLYALTNANTWNTTGTLTKLKDTFRDYLKNDNDTYIIPFTSYFLVSAHRIMRELSEVDFWDIYPSSEAGKVNGDLLYFAQKAAHSFNREFHDSRLLVRHKNTVKRHSKSAAKRIEIGCDEELDTMILNDYYQDKLKGKSVVIIDDFTRIGTSCETARILLEKAGVTKIIFIAMGKFGFDKNHYRYKYEISGSPFKGLKYKKVSYDILSGTLNNNSNYEFLTSLSRIL